MPNTYTLFDIAKHIGAELNGDGNSTVTGIASLRTATPSQISFLDNPRYQDQLANTQACAVILAPQAAANCPVATLVIDSPYAAYAKAAMLFDDRPAVTPGVHPSAVIDSSATVADGVSISANCVIGANVSIASGAIIGAGCIIDANCTIGTHARLYANVTLYHGVTIGARCTLHSGVVIGSDGFGMAKHNGAWLKVPQLGGVTIGDDVEIGANTVVDRGALEDTQIANDVKLDNLIQVAHNVQIGEHTAIAGCTAIAGSTTIGKHCLIGGGVCLTGHINITDNVAITGMTAVDRSVKTPGVYGAGVQMQPWHEGKRNAIYHTRLHHMTKRLAHVEKQLKHVVNDSEE